MRIFHHSHSKSQLKSFMLIELLMMIIFLQGGMSRQQKDGGAI